MTNISIGVWIPRKKNSLDDILDYIKFTVVIGAL